MKTRTLFLSFTSLLYALKKGSVTGEDIASGLFYLGCAREHAMRPGADGEDNELEWYFKDDLAKGHEVHERLVADLEKAELDGRCIWRQKAEMRTFSALDEMLVKNGIVGFPIHREDRGLQGDFSTIGVCQRIEKAALPLKTVPN